MEIKSALGKLRVPHDLAEMLVAERFLELPVRIAHTTALRRLPAIHRDPFDWLLVAQAQIEPLSVVTSDAVFARYQVPVISTSESIMASSSSRSSCCGDSVAAPKGVADGDADWGRGFRRSAVRDR
jgi:hypothetical protein